MGQKLLLVVVLSAALVGCEAKSSFAPTPPPAPGTTVPPAFSPIRAGPNGGAIVAGSSATFQVSGGDGNYSWSAPGGSPAFGTGSSFTTVFYQGGRTEYVTVTSGDGQRVTLKIGVALPPP